MGETAHTTHLASCRQQGRCPHRAEPRFLAEEMSTHLASPTPTQGRAGLELTWENRPST